MDLQRLEQRFWEIIRERFPYKGKNKQLDVTRIEIIPPAELGSLEHELQLKMQSKDLLGSVRARIVLSDLSGQKLDETTMTIAKVPFKTIRDTYLIGGNEKVIWNQLRLRPGAYVFGRGKDVETQIMLNYGKSTILRFKPEEDRWVMVIAKKDSELVPFLHIFGITDDQVRAVLGAAAEKHLRADNAKTIKRIHDILLPRDREKGRSTIEMAEAIRQYYENQGFGTEGEKAVSITLGHAYSHVTGQLLLDALKRMVALANHDKTGATPDDKDDLRFQQVIADEDFMAEKFEQGLIYSLNKLKNNLDEPANKKVSQVLFTNAFGRSLLTFMREGSVVDYTEQTNPLHLLSSQRRITQLGDGGMTLQQATLSTRNLQNTGFARLDPVETQESQKIGLVSHLARDAKVKDGALVASYYRVKDGVADTNDRVEFSPAGEFQLRIAFNNPALYTRKGDKLLLKHAKIPVRRGGEITEVPWDQVDLLDVSPHAHLSYAANLIPFAHHDDGNRMLMGSNMQKQAIPLLAREAPLVQTAIDEKRDRTYEQLIAELASNLIYAPDAGAVKEITSTAIVITDPQGKDHKLTRYDYFPLNHDNYIHNKPLVAVGDKVKKGQLLAQGWHTDDSGTLALGLNVRTAYMPWKGYNFEDGFVISESLAERMTSEEVRTMEVPIAAGVIGGPGSKVKSLLIKEGAPVAKLANLDEDGLVRTGSQVKSGDILVGMLQPASDEEMSPEDQAMAASGLLPSVKNRNRSRMLTGFVNGIVTDIRVLTAGKATEKEITVKIWIREQNKMKVGDKLAGRHGNKGTVTLILPDNKMPRSADGKPVELLISPLTVPSRKNLGQLYEVNAGLIAEKTGKPWTVYNYDTSEAARVQKALEEIGVPDGKITLFNPETGKPYENNVTVGQLYVMKLKHKVDEKFQARSIGDEHFVYLMPKKVSGDPAGEKKSPQKLGEFEFRALQAHKAVYNILESSTLKSDGVQSRVDLFRALAAGGRNLPDATTPVSLQVFGDKLKALGLNMVALRGGNPATKGLDDLFEDLLLLPVKEEDIRRLAPKEVTEGRGETRYQEEGKTKKESGGLFDPEIFGETDEEKRRKWGRIDLAHPMPNPLYLKVPGYSPYTILTGKSTKELQELLGSERRPPTSALITNPGDTGLAQNAVVSLAEIEQLKRSGKRLEFKIHGEALEALLAQVDVKADLPKVERALRVVTKPDERDRLFKKYRILQNLATNNLAPTDYMLKSVPVLPVNLRPIYRTGGGQREIIDDANELYARLIRKNQEAKAFKEWKDAPLDKSAEEQQELYQRLTQLFGYDDEVTIDGKALRPIYQTFKGKQGLIRGRLMAKYQDYSGRSVISSDPTLKIDQMGLPYQMAYHIYKPFVEHKLIQLGFASNPLEAEAKWRLGIRNPDVVRAIEAAVKERPVLLNRQPSLHKFSIMAFEPVLRKAHDGGIPPRSVALNPLVTTGFGADFDGDTMAVHVPITPEAVREADRLMRPSQSLINPTNGEIEPMLKHEMLLGLFYLTKRVVAKPGATVIKAPGRKELEDAYFGDRLHTYDLVDMGGRVGTVGQHLAFGLLPRRVQLQVWQDKPEMSKKVLERILKDIIENPTKAADEGSQAAVAIMDQYKHLGFEAATKSGMSIGIKDLVAVDDIRESLLEEAAKMVERDPGSVAAAYGQVEQKLEQELSIALEEADSPVYYMVSSGARGKPSEVRAMAGMLGLSKDITQKVIERPVLTSFKEGLTPEEFWIHAYDARRGLASRALGTAGPGALTRRIYMNTQDVIVAIADCKDTAGLRVAKFTEINGKRERSHQWRALSGRFLARAVGTYPERTFIDRKVFAALDGDDTVLELWVRSPVKCRAAAITNRPNSICQTCYGTMPGTMDLPVIGEPVGAVAAHAMGEPLSQGSLSAFHTSGVSGARVTAGLPRIVELLNLTANLNPAAIAQHTGSVVVNETPTHWLVHIGKAKAAQKVPKGNKLLVQDGDAVQKGDKLTYGDYRPLELFQYQGLDVTQEYLVNSLDDAISLSGLNIDPRHLEVIVGRTTNKAVVSRRGTGSRWLEGEVVDRGTLERWNAQASTTVLKIPASDIDELVGTILAKDVLPRYGGAPLLRKGEVLTPDKIEEALPQIKDSDLLVYARPVQFTPELYTVGTNPYQDRDNWLGQVGFENPARTLARASAFGEKERFTEPRSRYMAGKPMNVGQHHFTDFLQDFQAKAKQAGRNFIGLFGL